jgi:hypothetical protein
MLIDRLPIAQAIATGKHSRFYKQVASAYSRLMKELLRIQKGIPTRGILAIPEEPITSDYYDRRRDRFQSTELAKYKGTFGVYFQE